MALTNPGAWFQVPGLRFQASSNRNIFNVQHCCTFFYLPYTTRVYFYEFSILRLRKVCKMPKMHAKATQEIVALEKKKPK